MKLLVWQQLFLIGYCLYAAVAAYQGFEQTSQKKNAYGMSPRYFLLGAFVWADSMVLGAFWVAASAITWFFQDWLLFLLLFSIFWLVRSVGETVYWFNQQFSPLNRNPIEKLPGYNFVHNDSIWFIYQVLAQCVTVVAAIATLYFAHQWVNTF